MSWNDAAYETINRVYHQQRTAGETDKNKVAAAIDAAYPFGERAMYPYKAWLNTRRKFFASHGLPLKERNQAESETGLTQPGLF